MDGNSEFAHNMKSLFKLLPFFDFFTDNENNNSVFGRACCGRPDFIKKLTIYI